ncbi:hypothetical protein QBC45DRAFT_216831 [Copromyces sp. CBS 386.78]|nr:hypothetical protein QBC45DRAFT_216831 [Copromyces sp. CBS 386.78]
MYVNLPYPRYPLHLLFFFFSFFCPQPPTIVLQTPTHPPSTPIASDKMSCLSLKACLMMPAWLAAIDVDTFINLDSRYHKRSSLDPRPQPTVEDVMNMDRNDKELINTPESDFAATDIHIGGIILGHDRWQEIDHWIEFMHRPSEDQLPLKATDDYPHLFENVCDDEIMPKDSATKWDSESVRAARRLAKERDVDYYFKRQRIAKEINPFTGRYNVQRTNLWLNTLPEYNPDLPPRATDDQRALHNSLCFKPHPHDDQDGNGPCRRCEHMVKTHPILHSRPQVYVRVTVISLEPPEEEEPPFCNQNWQENWQPEHNDGEEEEEASPPLDDWYETWTGVHQDLDSPHVSSSDDMDDPYSSSVKALFKSLYFKPQAHRHRRAYCRRCERRAIHELGAHLHSQAQQFHY